MAGDDRLVQLLTNRALPVARKGYDRDATDRLLDQLEEGLKATLRRHDEAVSRVGELERRLEEGHEREEAVTEALVVATQIRADSEREAEELKAKYLREAEAMKDEVKQEADEILKEGEELKAKYLREAEAMKDKVKQEADEILKGGRSSRPSTCARPRR